MTDDRPGGLRRWLTTVHHRDVARLYVTFGVVAGVWGGIDAMAVRTELLTPGSAVWGPETYASFFTTHGLTMLFFFATPIAFGLANLLIPPAVGADEMAFPRINATAFWLLPPALLLVRSGLVLSLLGVEGVSPAATGWTFFVPLAAEQANPALDLVFLGVHLSGVSTVMSAVNLLVTVGLERQVGWHRIDPFTWSITTTAGLVLFAFPVLQAALLMLILDRNIGTTFFTVEGGGPLLFQHLFWFFGHPEVYILALPAMGIISRLLPKYADRRLFGERAVVYSTLGVGVLAFGVWAHHMFATGIDPRIRASFMATTLAIAVPSAVKTFNWIATLWNGRIRLETPMLFCVGGVALFIVGGVTGVFLASIPVDLIYHGTYYVVGHFHFMLVGLVTFALFAGLYRWFPALTGRRYDPELARAHFLLSAVGVVIAFGAMMLLGLAGLPRRSATYPAQFALLQRIATVGAYVLGFGQLLALYNAGRSLLFGPPADGDGVGVDDAAPADRRPR